MSLASLLLLAGAAAAAAPSSPHPSSLRRAGEPKRFPPHHPAAHKRLRSLVREKGGGAAPAVATPSATSSSSAAAAAANAANAANATAIFASHLAGQWYVGASLVSDPDGPSSTGLSYVTSGGDYFTPPYPFFVAAGTVDDGGGGEVLWNISSAVPPGTAWPGAGTASAAIYSGLDFSSFAASFAVFRPSSALPVWSTRVEGPTDNVWETGPAAATSADGSVAVGACTIMSSDNPATATKRAVLIAAQVGGGGGDGGGGGPPIFPGTLFVDDTWPEGTGLELLRLSADGTLLVAVAAVQNETDGSIHSSLVRVYNMSEAGASSPSPSSSPFAQASGGPPTPPIVASFQTPYAYAACMSPSGSHLVLATTDSVDTIEVYSIGFDGATGVTEAALLANSSYPPSLPGTFQYVAACRVADGGMMMATFALFWGDAMNQSAVARYDLPSSPLPPPPASPYLAPSWLWLTTPVDPSLQDSPEQDALTPDGLFYAYTSAGGATPFNGTAGQVPPTLHIYRTGGGGGPLLEITTVAPNGEGTAPTPTPTSASLEALDMGYALDGSGDLVVLASGVDGHLNIGSDGGALYAWRIQGLAELSR